MLHHTSKYYDGNVSSDFQKHNVPSHKRPSKPFAASVYEESRTNSKEAAGCF
jgi:hypothetical protein